MIYMFSFVHVMRYVMTAISALAALRAGFLSFFDRLLLHDRCNLSCGRTGRPGAKNGKKRPPNSKPARGPGPPDPGKTLMNISIFPPRTGQK